MHFVITLYSDSLIITVQHFISRKKLQSYILALKVSIDEKRRNTLRRRTFLENKTSYTKVL